MGSIISKIYDNEDEYFSLCKEYGEKTQEIYSLHHSWIKKKAYDNYNQSFEEYRKIEERKTLEFQIQNKLIDIKNLQDKLKNYNV
jgi:hypothetical protein